MKLAIIGLGRMGANMVRRLLKGKHTIVVFNRSVQPIEELKKEGAIGAVSIDDVIQKLETPRVIWLMLPAGKITDEHIEILSNKLTKGDILIDGGNTYYKDDLRRSEELKKKGIIYMDTGVSGGIWGLKIGYAIMAGGLKEAFNIIEPAIKTLAPENGYLYCGPSGAGHFVKMVHNAIEYAMMEAYGEGFEVLKASPYGEGLDMQKIAAMWNHGSVIRSWLLELIEDIFKKDKDLTSIQGYVEDSGEARWTVKEAVDSGVAADVMATALFKRFNSRHKDVYANKIVAALRNEFGGHALAREGENVKSSQAGAGTIQHAKADQKKGG